MNDQFNHEEQTKKAIFEARTKGLHVLSNVATDLSNATQRYHEDMPSFCAALRFLIEQLEATLDDPPNKIPYSRESRDWLLLHCAKALDAHAIVAEHLCILDPMPLDGSILQWLAKMLYDILDPEGELFESVAITQHWIEVDLANEGLLSVKKAIASLESFLTTKSALRKLGFTHDETESSSACGAGEVAHSKDFRSVNWFGTSFSFTVGQANVVARLWQAWQGKNKYVSETALCDASGGESKRVRDIFKQKNGQHPAWGSMIVKERRDLYYLKPPISDQIPM